MLHVQSRGEKQCDLKEAGTGAVRGRVLDPRHARKPGAKLEGTLLAVHSAGRRPPAGVARIGLVSPARLPAGMVSRSAAVLAGRRALLPCSVEAGTAQGCPPR